jgi:probable HAF family extracellular repeat protein
MADNVLGKEAVLPSFRSMLATWMLLAAPVGLICADRVSAALEYTITDLGTLGGAMSVAEGINNCGQVVGYSALSNGDLHAFLYSSGVMSDLGTLGGASSQATAVNASGQVVGVAATADSPEHAFVYSGGVMMDLGTLGGTLSGADGINDSGQIVGSSTISGDNASHAFSYSNGSMIDLVDRHP